MDWVRVDTTARAFVHSKLAADELKKKIESNLPKRIGVKDMTVSKLRAGMAYRLDVKGLG